MQYNLWGKQCRSLPALQRIQVYQDYFWKWKAALLRRFYALYREHRLKPEGLHPAAIGTARANSKEEVIALIAILAIVTLQRCVSEYFQWFQVFQRAIGVSMWRKQLFCEWNKRFTNSENAIYSYILGSSWWLYMIVCDCMYDYFW